MKLAFVLPVAALVIASSSFAQARIWRCGNAYTNDQAEAQSRGCKLVEGGNVTVVSGTQVNRVNASGPGGMGANGSAPVSGSGGVRVAAAPVSRIDSQEQRARDSEARTILEAELKKAETRYAELQKEFNNGEPEKQGPEHKNHQKYLDRVAELKSNLARTESDIANLRREISRAK